MTAICYRLLCTVFTALPVTGTINICAQGCEKVRLTDFPKSDVPARIDTSQSMREKLKEQGSYKFYYGIGVPIDYVKARTLAFCEMALNKGEEDPFGGASVLMMLYANGFGVKKDWDLSIRLACANVGFADAEIEGRVEHLKRLQSGEEKGVFDLCDDITSGYMMGFCEGVHSELEGVRRQATVDSVLRGWPEKDRAAHALLRKAASDFFTARTLSEVDMSGTARAALVIEEGESLEEGFKQDIVAADKCAFDAKTEQDWQAADAKLNSVYSKIMKSKNPEMEKSTLVTKEGIRTTQRAWIRYRDACVNFGAVRCPGIGAVTFKTRLTEERTTQLEELLGMFDL
jgi:uncharacterized protein YecT (DUF1311 family)